LAVQGGRDPSQRVAALTQVTDFREHTLLARIGLNVLAVRAGTESKPDIRDRGAALRPMDEGPPSTKENPTLTGTFRQAVVKWRSRR
jgi:hypothetical protein